MKTSICHFLIFLLILAVLTPRGFSQSSLTLNAPGTISTYVRTNTFSNGAAATSQSIGSVRSVVVAKDPQGGFYLATPEDNRVYRVLSDGRIFIAAGSIEGYSGQTGDGGPAVSALLRYPNAVAVDNTGNVLIADGGNNQIRRITKDGVISTYLGGVYYPSAVAVDSANNLYIGSQFQVRKITPTGVLTIVAGTGVSGFSGDGGPAANAAISRPEAIAVDTAGNVYIADALNSRVRKVTPQGVIMTVAGNGIRGFNGDTGLAISLELNYPDGLAVDAANNLYIADYGNRVIRKVTLDGRMQNVAGNSSGQTDLFGSVLGGFSGDGGPATSARLSGPIGLDFDGSGNLYIADSNNKRIRQVTAAGIIRTVAGNGDQGGAFSTLMYGLAVDPSGNLYVSGLTGNAVSKIGPNGVPVPFAGNGTYGFFGDGGPAVNAWLEDPGAIATDNAGNVYIADTENNRIRKVSPTGTISTVAGTGIVGFSGDGGPATAARFAFPRGVAVDKLGNIYISDTQNNRIRKVTPDGIINTVAGNGQDPPIPNGGQRDGIATNVSLWSPTALAVDLSGALLICDTYNQRVRKLTPDGQLTTIVGNGIAGFNGDGFAAVAQVFGPSGLTLDSSGNIYLADTNNQRIRKISPTGLISTIAGSGVAGYNGDGGPATAAELYAPQSIALDRSGVLFIVDLFNAVIRKVPLTQSATFSISNSGSVSSQTTGAASHLATGYARVTPYNGSNTLPGLEILGFRNSDNVLVSETSLPASSAIASGRVYAEINSSVNTGLAIVNPNSEPVTMAVFFTDATGDTGHQQITIPANGHVAAFMNESPFNGPSAFRGTLTFASSAPVVVLALRSSKNERSEFLFTSLPVIDISAKPAEGAVWIPHFAAGEGWKTQVVLVNPTDSTLTGAIQFSGRSGAPVRLNVNGEEGDTFTYSIPPGTSQTFQTAGGSLGSGILSGRVQILPLSGSGPAPSAFAIFSTQRNGITVAEAAITTGVPDTTFETYGQISGDFVHAATGSTQTGFAIANTTEEAVAVDVTVPANGSLPERKGSLMIPANGQIAAFLTDIPGLSSLTDYNGTVHFQSSGPVSVISLRGRYNERGDFLMSATQPAPGAAAVSAAPLFFPHFADSANFTTEFILFNGKTAQPSSGYIVFFTDLEEPLGLIIQSAQ